MDSKFQKSFVAMASFAILISLSVLANAQTSASKDNGFIKAQKAFFSCGDAQKDEFQGAAININRISKNVIEVFVSAGVTRSFQTMLATDGIEVFVQPLKLVSSQNEKPSLFEVGQPASLKMANALDFSEDSTIATITPKITLPVQKEAMAVRVKILGLFGAGEVSTITTYIDGENTASICHGRRKS